MNQLAPAIAPSISFGYRFHAVGNGYGDCIMSANAPL